MLFHFGSGTRVGEDIEQQTDAHSFIFDEATRLPHLTQHSSGAWSVTSPGSPWCRTRLTDMTYGVKEARSVRNSES